MENGGDSRQRWFHRIQSLYVLPLARGMYLLIALVSLLVVVGGSIYALYLQAVIASQPSSVPIPPPYQESGSPVAATAQTLDIGLVGSRLEPPTNIRLNVRAGTITAPLRRDEVIGYFQADTKNNLATSSEAISILGGKDADFFERVYDAQSKAIGLKGTALLEKLIADELFDIKEPTSRNFEIRIVARDRFLMLSEPTNISFTLNFGPKVVAASEPMIESKPELTELQKIAADIASLIEPSEEDSTYSKAYYTATKVPERCNVSDRDQRFISNYRRAFDQIRPRLNATNVEAFYSGLCDAWKDVLMRESAERERVERLQGATRRQAEDVRASAQAQNYNLQRQHEITVMQAKANTWLTMTVVGSALAIFLSISLILAFLAIENHSRAVRTAIESLVRISEEKSTTDTVTNQT